MPAEQPDPHMRRNALNERRFRVFEASIVITVVFGAYIFYPVFSAAGDLNLAGVFRIPFYWLQYAFEFASGLALLGYVLCLKARVVGRTESIAPAQSETIVMPVSSAGGPFSWIRQVSLLEWSLILAVACRHPLADLLYSCPAQFH